MQPDDNYIHKNTTLIEVVFSIKFRDLSKRKRNTALDAADVKSSLVYCFLVTYAKKEREKSTLRIMEAKTFKQWSLCPTERICCYVNLKADACSDCV